MKPLSFVISIFCFLLFLAKGVCAYGGNGRCPLGALAPNGVVRMVSQYLILQAALWDGPLPNIAMAPRSNTTDIFILMTTPVLSISYAIRFRSNMDNKCKSSSTLFMGILAKHLLCHVATPEADLLSSFTIYLDAWVSLINDSLSIKTWNGIVHALLRNGTAKVGLAQIHDLCAYIDGFVVDGINSSVLYPVGSPFGDSWAPIVKEGEEDKNVEDWNNNNSDDDDDDDDMPDAVANPFVI